MQYWQFNKHSALRDAQRVSFASYRGIIASALDRIFTPWSLLHLEFSVNDQEGFF